MFPSAALLHISTSGLSVTLPGRSDPAGAPTLPSLCSENTAEPAGDGLAAWLHQHPQHRRWRLLVDLDDESHFVEELPRLRGKDGHALLQRRLRHWFDDPSHAHARLLAPAAGGRQRVLFAGLNRPQRLRPIVHAITASGARIEALVAASSLLAHYGSSATLHTACGAGPRTRRPDPAGAQRTPQLLLSTGQQAIRLMLCEQAMPRLTRLLAVDTPTAVLCTELARTLDYGRDLIASKATDPTPDICLLVHPAHQADWQQTLAAAGLCHRSAVFSPAAQRILETANPASIDPLLLHWLAHAPQALLRTLGWPLPANGQPPVRRGRRALFPLAAALAVGGSLPLTMWPEKVEQPLPEAPVPTTPPVGKPTALPPAAPTPEPPTATTATTHPADAAVRLDGVLRSTRGNTVVWLDGQPQTLPAALRIAPYPALQLRTADATAQRLSAGADWLTDASTAAAIRSKTTAPPPAGAELNLPQATAQ